MSATFGGVVDGGVETEAGADGGGRGKDSGGDLRRGSVVTGGLGRGRWADRWARGLVVVGEGVEAGAVAFGIGIGAVGRGTDSWLVGRTAAFGWLLSWAVAGAVVGRLLLFVSVVPGPAVPAQDVSWEQRWPVGVGGDTVPLWDATVGGGGNCVTVDAWPRHALSSAVVFAVEVGVV